MFKELQMNKSEMEYVVDINHTQQRMNKKFSTTDNCTYNMISSKQ